jgi:hypothetical protein
MSGQFDGIDPNINIVVIACNVFQHIIEKHLPDSFTGSITYLDYGLHRVPKNLSTSLQDFIDGIHEPSLVVLGYGLCGNGLHGIQAGKHYLLVPRTDDCIAIFLGSYTAYNHQFSLEPGTIYLTKGWLESGSDPLREYQKCLQQYDRETALWIMDQQYQHYQRLVFVAHNKQDLETYRPQVMEVAQFCKRWNMRYEEVMGTAEYIRFLVNTALDKNTVTEEFILIKPGGSIQQHMFLRQSPL